MMYGMYESPKCIESQWWARSMHYINVTLLLSFVFSSSLQLCSNVNLSSRELVFLFSSSSFFFSSYSFRFALSSIFSIRIWISLKVPILMITTRNIRSLRCETDEELLFIDIQNKVINRFDLFFFSYWKLSASVTKWKWYSIHKFACIHSVWIVT